MPFTIAMWYALENKAPKNMTHHELGKHCLVVVRNRMLAKYTVTYGTAVTSHNTDV